MELVEEKMDEGQLRGLSTSQLVRQALSESKLLVRAELLHAKTELKEEAQAAKGAAVFFGSALLLSSSAITLLFMALALALPVPAWAGALIVAGGLLLVTGGLAFLGKTHLPKHFLKDTQARLRTDVEMTKGELQ